VATIMLVEDNEHVAEAFKRGMGFFDPLLSILHAHTLAEAEQLVQEHGESIRVIAWDGRLPDGNSWEGAIQKARTILPDIPMVAMSGDDGNKEKQVAAGCTVAPLYKHQAARVVIGLLRL